MRFYTKYRRKLRKFTEFCDAQWFYAKKYSRQAIITFLNGALLALKVTLAAILVLTLTLLADKMHSTYLEGKVGSNVLYIKAMPNSPIQGSATGFEVKAKSGKVYTLTNAHVCALRNADNLILVHEKRNSGRFIPKRVLEVYPDNDLCIVEGLEGYEGLSLGQESSTSDRVTAIGYPMGEGLNISKGRVKAFSKIQIIANDIPIEKCHGDRLQVETITFFFLDATVCMRSYDSIATDLSIFPGNSGSPLVDWKGDIVGVVFASDSRTTWGYAVPFKDVKKLLDAY